MAQKKKPHWIQAACVSLHLWEKMGLISCRGFGEIILLGEIISAILSVTGLQCYWVVVELPGPVIVFFLSVCFFFI